MLWRLLRIGSAPTSSSGNDRRTGAPARYRIASPWDWRAAFELERVHRDPGRGRPAPGGLGVHLPVTPGGRWPATVAGHVEIRWSHGRFAQPPEAKVYLDTPMADLPGYHPL